METVAEGTISTFISATANLVAEDDVQIVAETEGKATHLYVEEGDYVKKGQKLLQVDPADRQLEVKKAELALRNATIYLERGEKMTADQLISAEDLDKLRYDRERRPSRSGRRPAQARQDHRPRTLRRNHHDPRGSTGSERQSRRPPSSRWPTSIISSPGSSFPSER